MVAATSIGKARGYRKPLPTAQSLQAACRFTLKDNGVL